jgi:hypothetical protein
MKHGLYTSHQREAGVWLLLALLVFAFLMPLEASARRNPDQIHLPTPKSYKDYRLRVITNERRPETGNPIVFKAELIPHLPEDDAKIHFIINGKTYPVDGIHKVHIFEKTGTYKISAVARIGGSHLLNSPPLIVHVVEAWELPVAAISPQKLVVEPGEPAIFTSNSVVDEHSRQWLYWSMSTGHRGSGEEFRIDTRKLAPGKYPVELLLRDDRKRESIQNALLIIKGNGIDENELSVETEDTNPSQATDDGSSFVPPEPELVLHASQTHRLAGKSIVFWIQNAQLGADTLLKLNTGDGDSTPWGRQLRYTHSYPNYGIYTIQATGKTPLGTYTSNAIKVFIWPLWLPVLMVVMGLLLAGIPFFRNKPEEPPAPIINLYFESQNDKGLQKIFHPDNAIGRFLEFEKTADTGVHILIPSAQNNPDNPNPPYNPGQEKKDV